MANIDKNIIITPYVSGVTQPEMKFVGQGNDPIYLKVLDGLTGLGSTAGGALSIEGSAGQLFSIVNRLGTGSIFSVNDISGIPMIDANADGTISIAGYFGNVGVGLTAPTQKFQVTGNAYVSGVVTAISGICASGGTFSGNISASNIVNSVNGYTGNVGGLISPVGMTSGSLRVYTYPDGVTTTTTKTPFYSPSNMTHPLYNNGFIAYPNRTYFTLHNVNRSTNIKTLKCTGQNTGITGNAYITVWSMDPITGYPSSRLYASTSLVVGSGYNTTSVTNAGGLLTVPAGYFFIAFTFSLNPTVYGVSLYYTLSTYGSGSLTSGYNNSSPVLDTSGFTAPTSITQAGSTFAFIDYTPSYVAGILTEFGIV